MMFYYKDITEVCTEFLRVINAVSMCGMAAAVALRVLRKLCRIRHKWISVLKGVCVLCLVFWLVSMFGEVISVQKVFLIKDMPYAIGMALAAVITFLIIKIFGSNYKRMKRGIKKCSKFIR